jgi:hypothetical protein
MKLWEDNMVRRVWINNTYETRGNLVNEVESVLLNAGYYNGFDVELFGVSYYAKELPDSYKIVDYGSRETLAVCDDGYLICGISEVNKWELNRYTTKENTFTGDAYSVAECHLANWGAIYLDDWGGYPRDVEEVIYMLES